MKSLHPFIRSTIPEIMLKGLALGWPISDKLVRLMGGRLEVTSEPGKGSRFRFDVNLPAVANVSEAALSSEEKIVAMRGD